MKTVIDKVQTLKDILCCYSGRRLQFAIKLGILPKPENLKKLLKKKATARSHTFQTSTLTNQGVNMKLPRLMALPIALTAVLFATPMAVLADVKLADTKLADAKNEIIDKQQKMTQEELDASKKGEPANEQRPAAITSHKKHSTESPKGSMIKKQMQAVDKDTKDAEAAKPKVENRPAITTDYK